MVIGALLIPFVTQLALAIAAFLCAIKVGMMRRAVWVSAAVMSLACMLLWPLMRVFPVLPIEVLGAPFVACVELTGLAIPAVLFFGIAGQRTPKASDRKAILLLTAVAALYFLKAGWWMVSPGVPDLGRTNVDASGVCLQSTGYTCAAASMVTMLQSFKVEASETEMARLSFTQVDGGATDSRVLWALEKKLRGTGLVARYRRLDATALIDLPKPCLVQMDWGYFISHMVPVMEASSERVVIGDPLTGRREMTMAEFGSKWKGNAISIDRRYHWIGPPKSAAPATSPPPSPGASLPVGGLARPG